MRNWDDVLPKLVAERQRSWERKQLAFRMRANGFSLREVGNHFGVGRERARVMCLDHEHSLRHGSPAERYFRLQAVHPSDMEGGKMRAIFKWNLRKAMKPIVDDLVRLTSAQNGN